MPLSAVIALVVACLALIGLIIGLTGDMRANMLERHRYNKRMKAMAAARASSVAPKTAAPLTLAPVATRAVASGTRPTAGTTADPAATATEATPAAGTDGIPEPVTAEAEDVTVVATADETALGADEPDLVAASPAGDPWASSNGHADPPPDGRQRRRRGLAVVSGAVVVGWLLRK